MLSTKDTLMTYVAFLKSVSATPLPEVSYTPKAIWDHFARENTLLYFNMLSFYRKFHGASRDMLLSDNKSGI